MKIIQVIPSLSEESSGPSYSVPAMCTGLVGNGCDVSLFFVGKMPKRCFGFPVHAFPTESFPHPRLGRSPKMLKGLGEACRTADIIHNNSFWMFPNVYPFNAIKKSENTRCKLVNAPRGTLAEWSLKHHWLQKKLFGWFGGQYAAMAATDMWHATCEKEYEEIRALGYRQPVAIVPIGMDLPELKPRNALNAWNRDRRNKRVVFFGRLHKVKAIDNLILAWEKICSQLPPNSSVCSVVQNWELVIAGPDGGIRGYLEEMVADRKIPRVSFVGEINGQSKYEFLSAADIYVLPSHTENFGITVAEALACGTPVIASQGTPWQGVERERCGRWVPIGVEPLAAALKKMMVMDNDERRYMGERAREWMARDFSWKGIGAKMKEAYEWLLGQGDRPEWVRVD